MKIETLKKRLLVDNPVTAIFFHNPFFVSLEVYQHASDSKVFMMEMKLVKAGPDSFYTSSQISYQSHGGCQVNGPKVAKFLDR